VCACAREKSITGDAIYAGRGHRLGDITKVRPVAAVVKVF
jgi:hypothetical protein